jgi:hypothetical protein
MVSDNLARFQSDILSNGEVIIEGFWQKKAQDSPEDPPILGPLEQKLRAVYQSLEQADQKAVAFPAFAQLAENFATAPFTTIAALLLQLRLAQEAEEAARQALLMAPPSPQSDL